MSTLPQGLWLCLSPGSKPMNWSAPWELLGKITPQSRWSPKSTAVRSTCKRSRGATSLTQPLQSGLHGASDRMPGNSAMTEFTRTAAFWSVPQQAWTARSSRADTPIVKSHQAPAGSMDINQSRCGKYSATTDLLKQVAWDPTEKARGKSASKT